MSKLKTYKDLLTGKARREAFHDLEGKRILAKNFLNINDTVNPTKWKNSIMNDLKSSEKAYSNILKKQNIARGLTGIGAATGIGATAYGVNRLKKREEKMAFEIVNESFDKIARTYYGLSVCNREKQKI